MSIIKIITNIASESAAAWDQAVDTAGPEYSGGSEEKAEAMQSLADECDETYEACIDALEARQEGWAAAARAGLEQAKTLESEGGDCSHALRALEALDEYIAKDAAPDSTVAIEILSIGSMFDLPDDCEQDRDMEWYGTVSVKVGEVTYQVGAVIGVPESDRGSCRAAGSGVRPFLTAWYADSSDWSGAGVPQELAGDVIGVIAAQARTLWHQAQG